MDLMWAYPKPFQWYNNDKTNIKLTLSTMDKIVFDLGIRDIKQIRQIN